ncbi:hypothetical protein BJX63DRAFT_133228 [Aspergillus granulosus]|uniref:Uncharacterized protein n=1 Tax=Aspergillus granulosus TaxID=176169 RepID=A0ABR4GSY5_9EURO
MLPDSKDAPQEKFVFVGGPTLDAQSSNVRSVLLRRVLHERRAKRRKNAAEILESMLSKRSTALSSCAVDANQDVQLEATGYPLIRPRKTQNNQTVRFHGSQNRSSKCGGLLADHQRYLPDPHLFGAGRRDPLLPMDARAARLKIHELLDFTATTIWARFRQLDYPGNCYRAWVLPFDNELQLYSVLWSSSYHRDILRVTNGAIVPKLDSQEQLELRLLALRALQREIANVSDTTSPDSLVMCMLFLAVNDIHKTRIFRDPSPFSPPFVSLQLLDFYGSRDYHPLHWNMLHDTVRRFGGIESLQTFALSWLLTLAALMRSAQTLAKPIYPIVGVAGKPLDLQSPSFLFQPRGYSDPFNKAGSGFHELFTMWPPVRQEVVQMLIDLGQYSRVVQHYSAAVCSPDVLDLLGDCRNAVHHRLLSLPKEEDLTESYLQYTEQDDAENELSREIYLTCRLAAVLYAVHVTFPLPRTQQIRELNLDALESRIARLCALNSSGPVVLWCAAVAISMLGDDSPKRLIAYMAHLIADTGVDTLDKLIDMLQTFAWVDAAVQGSWKGMWTRRFFSSQPATHL